MPLAIISYNPKIREVTNPKSEELKAIVIPDKGDFKPSLRELKKTPKSCCSIDNPSITFETLPIVSKRP